MEALVRLLGGEDTILRAFAVATLVAARIAPLTIIAPWIAMRGAPVVVRTALTLALTLCLAPTAFAAAPALSPSGLELGLLCVREALIGTVFAVATSVPLFALDWSGRLVDTWRGASLAEVIAPTTGERTSPLGDLALMLGIVLFVTLGGHRLAIAAFAEGLVDVPVGALSLGGGAEVVALGAARLVASALAFALALAAPAAVAIVLVELSLGLAARVAPQIPVFFAGMPLRAAVGVAAVLLCLRLVVDELPGAFRGAIDQARALLGALGP